MRSCLQAQTAIAEKASPKQKAAALIGKGRKSRIIAADNHPAFRNCLMHVLQEIGNLDIIACAEDGRQAVDLTKRPHLDLVLMAVNLPRMNGIEATRKIAGSLPDVRVMG